MLVLTEAVRGNLRGFVASLRADRACGSARSLWNSAKRRGQPKLLVDERAAHLARHGKLAV